MDNIIVFKDRMLPRSATFIKSQGEALKNYVPIYVGGSSSQPGISLPGERKFNVQGTNTKLGFEYLRYRLGFPSRKIIEALESFEPVLLHAHFGPDALMALPIARALQIPCITTFHGYDATVKKDFPHSYSHRVFFLRKERLAKEVVQFIAVSNFIKTQMIHQGFPEQKILVHYIGVDIKLFEHFGIYNQRKPVVLFVGRLVEKKGCSFLIKAMERVQANLPDVELVVIGDGALRNKLESEAASRLKQYKFLGSQPYDRVQEWMGQASVFCVPSIIANSGDAEGFGMVFIEAQASGLPVVSFDSGGISEAIEHNKSGYLAPEGDWNSLANYILKLLTNHDTWQEFSNAGIERVKHMFNLKMQTAKLEAIYDEVLHRPRSIN